MWLAVLAGSLIILGLMRMAQGIGVGGDQRFRQGAVIFFIGVVLGLIAVPLWLG
jgi:hypothetical protein